MAKDSNFNDSVLFDHYELCTFSYMPNIGVMFGTRHAFPYPLVDHYMAIRHDGIDTDIIEFVQFYASPQSFLFHMHAAFDFIAL